MAKQRICLLPSMVPLLLLLLSLHSAIVVGKKFGDDATGIGIKGILSEKTASDSNFERGNSVEFEAKNGQVTGEQGVPFMTAGVDEISGRSFDYIIVGGGTCACPLAATLSERYSVLIVERGGLPYGNPDIEDRKHYGNPLFKTDEFTSVAQAFVSEDGVSNIRGRVLGGTTAINSGFYSRASEAYIEKAGWNAELVEEAYEWVESKIEFRPEPLSPFQSVAKEAMVEAGVLPFNGFTLQHLEGTKIGGSIFDKNGKRHTAADLLRAGNRERITVLLNTTVHSIIFHRHQDNRKRARASGIRFIKSHGNTSDLYEAYINHDNGSNSWGDVILSAGALGSPQILMLSGIGAKEHLKHLNIPVLVNTRHVGEGIQDNPSVMISLKYSQSLQQLPDPIQVVAIADSLRLIAQVSAIRLNNVTIFPLVAKVATPVSRGFLKLRNTDPRQNPSVKFNYLLDKTDLDECVRMAKLLDKIAKTKSMYMFLGAEQTGIVQNGSSTEENLRDFCKRTVSTYYHFHGGCLVGSVVDKDYRVFGVNGLRVLDGSTLTDSPGTNPSATLMMLGRYQGIKILEKRRSKLLSESISTRLT